jgi:hypothetical protein
MNFGLGPSHSNFATKCSFYCELGTELSALECMLPLGTHMLGMHATTELYPQSLYSYNFLFPSGENQEC